MCHGIMKDILFVYKTSEWRHAIISEIKAQLRNVTMLLVPVVSNVTLALEALWK